MKDDHRHNQLPPPEGLEDRPDGFISVVILAFIVLGPLIYFGPQLGTLEARLVDFYRLVDSWMAPVRDFVLG